MAVGEDSAKPEEHTIGGQTFYNAALTGSGTILPDGTYGPPIPDPTVLRGGPVGERKSPGGVTRTDPNELTPSAQPVQVQSGGQPKAVTSRQAKQDNAPTK